MSLWLDQLRHALRTAHVSEEDLRDITARLLDYGIIWRGDTQVETLLYEAAARIEDVLRDYFGLTGFRLYHDEHHQYIRVFPPGGEVPGLPNDDFESRGFRKHLSTEEVAGALALRFLYQRALAEGNIDDDSEAARTLEEFNTALQVALKRELPPSAERASVLRELARLRLVRFEPQADLDAPETLLFIRPSILMTVSEEVLAAALSSEGLSEAATPTAAEDVTVTAVQPLGPEE